MPRRAAAGGAALLCAAGLVIGGTREEVFSLVGAPAGAGAASLVARPPRAAGAAAPGTPGPEPPAERAAGAPAWARTLLAAAAAAVVALSSAPGPAAAEGAQDVEVYFGQGCFWHVQNELVNQEAKVLGRSGAQITALAGYAGGTSIGPKGEVCYHNRYSAPDYGQMGHTEVVGMRVPEDKIGEIGKVLLDFAASSPFGRHDPQDMGGEYRSAIGLPGGMSGAAFQQIKEVSGGKLEFLPGKGNDDDTVGSKKVWVYDTAKFPFYQGEVYHQFHDDMLDRYPDDYHKLREEKFGAGSLKKVRCPDMQIKS